MKRQNHGLGARDQRPVTSNEEMNIKDQGQGTTDQDPIRYHMQYAHSCTDQGRETRDNEPGREEEPGTR